MEKGYSIRSIARQLGRSHSNILGEIKRNSVRGRYDPIKADHKAYVRRKYAKYQGMKIAENESLKKYVDDHLYDDQSPEAIAGRIAKHEKRLPSISKDSIRRYIKSIHGRRVEYHRIQQKRKRKRGRKRPKTTKLQERTFIDKRPKYIQERRHVGDAEADFLLSCKTGKGIILSLADRKIRVGFLEQILRVTIVNVHKAFQKIKERLPELKSISIDNDLLLQKHKELERLLGVKIYFCHPYHSWEKGTIENTNKYIRREIPKGSDISRYSEQFIKKLEDKLNRRYMKVLDYKTPQEKLNEHRKRKKRLRALKERLSGLIEP